MTVETALCAVEAELEKQCADSSGPIREVCRYATQGGRRTRAALLLSAAPNSEWRTVQAATALELLHAATLLQDDIFDQGRMRRGRIAAHLQFGKALTILASDWLMIRSLELAAEIDPRFFRHVARAGTAMAQAEACELEPSAPHSIEDAQRMNCTVVHGKTAMLFGACLYGAAILRGISIAECSRWEELGISMGMTYQLVDDCVDLYGDERNSGKTIGGDFVAGRLTLPMLLGMAALQKRGTEISLEAWQAGQLKPVQALLLQTAVCSSQVQAHLVDLTHVRLACHLRDAYNANVAVSVVEAWSLDIKAKLAVCFPKPISSEPQNSQPAARVQRNPAF